MPSRSFIQQQYDVKDEQLDAVVFLAELSNDSSSANEEPASVITTHCAHIVLTKNRAYKIKRAVSYSYLDMSALSTRETLCKRELTLNKPELPSIYLEVQPITKDSNGSLALGGRGDVVEWVLVMARFSEHRVLDTMAKNGTLSNKIAKQVGSSIAQYHASLPAVVVTDGFDRMNEILVELDEELAEPTLGFDRAQLSIFSALGKK